MIFGQEDLDGRLLVLGELVQSGFGVSRFVSERLKPVPAARFPLIDPNQFIIAPDPAAGNRTGNDEKGRGRHPEEVVQVKIESNNRLPLRLDAIEHFTTRLGRGQSGVDYRRGQCPILVRALKGGWRYKLDKNEQVAADASPEKNPYSHPGDAFGYLCRFFHRQVQKNERYAVAGAKPFTPPRRAAAQRIMHAEGGRWQTRARLHRRR
jgi:hypothetical protein